MTLKNWSNISNWSLEDGYANGMSQKSYPIRVFNARQNAALHLFLQIYERDMDYICRGSVKGFKVFLRTPVTYEKYFILLR